MGPGARPLFSVAVAVAVAAAAAAVGTLSIVDLMRPVLRLCTVGCMVWSGLVEIWFGWLLVRTAERKLGQLGGCVEWSGVEFVALARGGETNLPPGMTFGRSLPCAFLPTFVLSPVFDLGLGLSCSLPFGLTEWNNNDNEDDDNNNNFCAAGEVLRWQHQHQQADDLSPNDRY